MSQVVSKDVEAQLPNVRDGEPPTSVLATPRRRAYRVQVYMILTLPALGTGAALALVGTPWFAAVDVLVMLALYVLTMLGITVGYHRLLAHRAFSAPAPVRAILVVLGAMCGQGPPLYWVAVHRRHHQFSDEAQDPHSPHVAILSRWSGFWHAHAGWMLRPQLISSVEYCRDLLRDPLLRKINRLYPLWLALGLLVPVAAGGLAHGSWRGALSGLLWGGLVRMFLSHHCTWSINSIAHSWGTRAFDTKEQSRNCAWLSLPSMGEAWHNNHHAYPRSAYFGLRWWQIDAGGVLISLLARFGMATDIKLPVRSTVKRAGGVQPREDER